jgi:hypothetical protein
MARIDVTKTRDDEDGYEFRVAVSENRGQTSHQVTLSRGDYEELSAVAEGPNDFVLRCFEWLLGREPKESILPRFDIQEISRYFPTFRDEIGGARSQAR